MPALHPHGTGTRPRVNFPPESAPGQPGCRKPPGQLRPLPDPTAVRLCLIPDPAPPYDADQSGDARPSAAPARGEVTAEGGRPGPAADGTGEHRLAAAVPPGWPSRFAQVLAETLAGSRPQGQMVAWTTEVARRHIQRLGPQLASVQRPRLRRVVTFQPAPGVLEMTIVVGFGPRVRALAVRLERADPHPEAGGSRSGPSRWLCTAVEAA